MSPQVSADDTAAELTCAQGADGRIYVGLADGSVRALAATAPESGELPLQPWRWIVGTCTSAVTSVCVVAGKFKDAERVQVVVGSASGELVVLCNALEVRRFQLEGAVQSICNDQDGGFVVGDVVGNLYGVTQYEILWKTQLPVIATRYGVGAECFYPGTKQPMVRAIAHTKLLDVEKTLSNYVLVATGQKHLLVTHRGKEFGAIPTRTPIGTLVSFPSGEEDVVLGAGEEGVIYRLVSYRDVASKDMPNFRFAMEKWTQMQFPVAKLLCVKPSAASGDAKPDDFTWICLGVDGEVALFRGQELVKQWDFTTSASEDNFPVDLALLQTNSADPKLQSAAIIFTDRIRVFSIDFAGQQ